METTRSPVVFSGMTFALLSLFGYRLFGWRLDGWILAFVAILHLALVFKWHPRFDRFLVGFHYLVALPGVAGIFWTFVDVGGTPRGSCSIFLSFFLSEWARLSFYLFWARYVFLVTSVFFGVILAVSWAINRRNPRFGELVVGFFVASLLNIPCELAIVDALFEMGAFRPERSGALIFAFGFENLSFPVIFHGCVALLITLSAVRSRRKAA